MVACESNRIVGSSEVDLVRVGGFVIAMRKFVVSFEWPYSDDGSRTRLADMNVSCR